MIAETTALGANISPGVADGEADWAHWFEPFFDFLEAKEVSRGFVYLNNDWSKTKQWKAWGDARVQNNPTVVTPNIADRMLNGNYTNL